MDLYSDADRHKVAVERWKIRVEAEMVGLVAQVTTRAPAWTISPSPFLRSLIMQGGTLHLAECSPHNEEKERVEGVFEPGRRLGHGEASGAGRSTRVNACSRSVETMSSPSCSPCNLEEAAGGVPVALHRLFPGRHLGIRSRLNRATSEACRAVLGRTGTR